MKTNFPFLALFLFAFHMAPDLGASPVAPFAFPDECAEVGIGEEFYYSPVHPGLALEEPRPVETYPCVNVSLAGDLCGVDGSPVSSRDIWRSSNYLSVELAEVAHRTRGPRQAMVNPVLALPLLLIVLVRSRRPQFAA
ncbi:MAG: hypothetical protein CMN05_03140 [Roseibacillus sp.]|jgi:hypothetical protein|nr:hypothetical protein [Roseibacillus sp.]MCP4730953.1 hypothetical protein [Roseibacillus sp.]MDP7108076.1 hypothetical protein [Roseibacillus sp.]MDP7308514.1 hypothetical protein [Roseibacillus sp.]MDP7656096.1 hypothetical protein [Roseibacillus sp.]|tara:strand:+ start:9809 stop:10222 length:414 start_codon:yes stop_codon:yes gene_type:complete